VPGEPSADARLPRRGEPIGGYYDQETLARFASAPAARLSINTNGLEPQSIWALSCGSAPFAISIGRSADLGRDLLAEAAAKWQTLATIQYSQKW
jgi:hypothetical protein